MTLQEAKEFINYNIKEGVYDEDDFDDMTDLAIIQFATVESERADYEYNSYQEE